MSNGFRSRRASLRADSTVSLPLHRGNTTATRAPAPRPSNRLLPAPAQCKPADNVTTDSAP